MGATGATGGALPSMPPLLLTQRGVVPPSGDQPVMQLPLSAAERTGLRGLRRSACGRPLLLQLPRGLALEPGEWLAPSVPFAGDPKPGDPSACLVQVMAAPERLLQVRSRDPLALLQAAYHLGNRHVAMEIHTTELRLLEDSVLAHLLEHRGLQVEPLVAPFVPEGGAYHEGHSHSHAHAHGHTHAQGHTHDPGRTHDDGH